MDREIEIKDLPAQAVLGIHMRSSIQRIGDDLGKAFMSLFSYLGEKGQPPAGPPLALYFDQEFNPEDFGMQVCVPTIGILEDREEIRAEELPAGEVASTTHRGPYSEISGAYHDLDAWILDNGYRRAGPAREIYLNDPSQVENEADILTEVQFPVTR